MGGSSSQVVGYRYYAKFAAFIGNRIEKLIAINFDNRKWVVHDPLKHPPNLLPVLEGNLFGENEGGVSGNIDIHFGTPDQEPNEVYQQYFPLVSGYPYQSYLVFHGGSDNKGFYLGNSGYMKEMLLWVKRTRVRNDGRAQWYEVRGDGAVVCEIGADMGGGLTPMQPSNITIQYKHFHSSQENTINYEQWGNQNTALLTQTNIQTVNWMGGGGSGGGLAPGDRERLFVYANKITIQNNLETLAAELIYNVASESHSIDFGLTNVLSSKKEYIGELEGKAKQYRLVVIFKGSIFEVICRATGYVYLSETTKSRSFFLYGGLRIALAKEIASNGGLDINPIHKIREILTDDTAMSKPESDVNDVNFMKAADRIYDEGLGISWAIDEKSCIEAIEELCYHIEAGIRVNRQTGLYEMVLFRDDWFEDAEIHAIAENKIKDLSLEVMNGDDIVNQLNVTYYDRQRIKNSTFSVYENGSILTMGHTNAESVEFPYFMNMRNAEVVANWKLKQFSTPAWSGSFTTGWHEARKWNRYDLIRLPWSKKWNGTILVRIMKINLGDGVNNTVTIDFEEVIPYSREMNTSIVVDAPVDSAPQPPQPSINTAFEAPYYLTVLKSGQTSVDAELSNNPDIGYVIAIAAKPQNNSLNALLFTDGGVGVFEQASRLDYCDILQLDQPIIETTSAFTVAGSLTQTANSNNLILLNNELMGFVSFDDETKVLTVKRGVLDTVPKKHSGGSLFVFDLPDVAFDSTQYAQNEIVEAQVLTTTPSGIQELAATGMLIEIQARAIRPYPPANVKINSIFKPLYIEGGLQLTWSNRNRLQQTGGEFLGYFEGSTTLEPNTQTLLTLIEYDENDVVLLTHNVNVTAANAFTLSEASMSISVRKIKIELKTVRDGFECLNPFKHTVLISNLVAPSDVTFEVIEL